MLTTLLLASASASNPADLEGWLPELQTAVDRRDESRLQSVFAELLARAPELSVRELRNQLRREMNGESEVECRGRLCRVQWVRPDDRSHLVLQRVDGEWRQWDESYGGHVAGPVSARLDVEGPGEVEIRVNGTPTFLFDPVRDQADAVLDRYLTPGINLVTLMPRGDVAVSLEVERGGRLLAAFDGALQATRTFTFTVDEGPRPLPR
ncbi:MAG: hypothetical protein AAF602_21400 [Myxococcota bacterium]